MTSLSRPRVEFISTILQTVLNLGLLCLGLILVVFLGKETVHLADVLFAPEQTSKYELVEGLVVYFLYFEFIALIVKYFQSGFHFPLRYFVYIGITAIVRLIIVDHKSPLDVLIYSAAILLLVITLWLCNSKRLEAGVKRQHAELARRAGQEDYSVAVCCVFFVSGSQRASSSSRVLPLVSGTNFHINSAARTPIHP